jgi:hypothetical protein
MVKAKKLTEADFMEIMMIEPLDDDLDFAEMLHKEIAERAYETTLQKLSKMAEVIENTKEGKMKDQMMIAYEKVDGELESWKRQVLQHSKSSQS